jgi:hypothetical protein
MMLFPADLLKYLLRGLRVFDWKSPKWIDIVADTTLGWPDWSHDSSSIYFLAFDKGSVAMV